MVHRKRLLILSLTAAVAMAGISASLAAPRKLLVSDIGSERATSGAGGKIVTFDGKTHVVWQDSTDKGYMNCVRTYDHATGKMSEPVTLNRGTDNHARPVITVDKQGYLHVVMSGHNSPVTYRRSVKPNDISQWTKAEPAGSGTYPVVLCGEDGALYLSLRSSSAWNGMDFYAKPAEEKWRKSLKVIKRDPEMPGYAGFACGMAWGPERKTMHIVADFYESKGIYDQRGLHQAVCYLRSTDFGKTWQRSDGTPAELPARPEQMDVLARDTGKRHEPMPPPVILSQGSIVVDAKDHPHVIYVSHLKEPGEIIHATTDDRGAWRQTSIDAVKKQFPKLRPVGCRGSLTMDAEGSLYVLMELVPLTDGWNEGKPQRDRKFGSEDAKRLVWLVSRDGGTSFDVQPALEDGADFHQANVQRSHGYNEIKGGQFPAFIYFDGTARKQKRGEVIQNNVYLVLPE